MDGRTTILGHKRARTSEAGLFESMQPSPAAEELGPHTEPADVLAFFAARGSRASAMQSEIAQLQERAQQQASQLEATEHENAALKVRRTAAGLEQKQDMNRSMLIARMVAEASPCACRLTIAGWQR